MKFINKEKQKLKLEVLRTPSNKGRARLGVDFFTFGPYTGVYTHYCTANKKRKRRKKAETGTRRTKRGSNLHTYKCK